MIFKLECTEGTSKTTVEFQEVFLPEVLRNIEGFLKACGYFLENLDCDIPSS